MGEPIWKRAPSKLPPQQGEKSPTLDCKLASIKALMTTGSDS